MLWDGRNNSLPQSSQRESAKAAKKTFCPFFFASFAVSLALFAVMIFLPLSNHLPYRGV
jgi:hypothetical protein